METAGVSGVRDPREMAGARDGSEDSTPVRDSTEPSAPNATRILDALEIIDERLRRQ